MTSSIPNVDAIGCPFLRQLQGGKTTSAAPLLERTGFRALEAHSSAGHGGVPDGGYDLLHIAPTVDHEGPNVMLGSPVNSVAAGVVGATISGGGDPSLAGGY